MMQFPSFFSGDTPSSNKRINSFLKSFNFPCSAGSRTLDELKGWSGYLINVQVVKLNYLKEAEARQLIKQPVKDFSLRYKPPAIQRIINLTRGHPHLVQQLCYELVELKNKGPLDTRRVATRADVEAAVLKIFAHGHFFFTHIEERMNSDQLALVRFLANHDQAGIVSKETLAQQFPNSLDHILLPLLRSDLIESVDGGYKFQVEIIRLWFAQERMPNIR